MRPTVMHPHAPPAMGLHAPPCMHLPCAPMQGIFALNQNQLVDGERYAPRPPCTPCHGCAPPCTPMHIPPCAPMQDIFSLNQNQLVDGELDLKDLRYIMSCCRGGEGGGG